MVLQCSNLYITKLLALECHYSPGPFPHVTAVNRDLGPSKKRGPWLDLTHFVSGKQHIGAGDVSLVSLLSGTSIVSAKAWAMRGTSRYQLLIDKGLGD